MGLARVNPSYALADEGGEPRRGEASKSALADLDTKHAEIGQARFRLRLGLHPSRAASRPPQDEVGGRCRRVIPHLPGFRCHNSKMSALSTP